MKNRSGYLVHFCIFVPSWQFFRLPLSNELAANERGLLGPAVILIIIVLLNIAVLAVAFRLRRVFRQIEDEADDEQTQATD